MADRLEEKLKKLPPKSSFVIILTGQGRVEAAEGAF